MVVPQCPMQLRLLDPPTARVCTSIA